MKKEVRIYTKDDCQYCDYAKGLLDDRGIAYREISVMMEQADGTRVQDYVLCGWLAWATGQRTLPQIFIDGEPVGGFADLMTMEANGELMRRIGK